MHHLKNIAGKILLSFLFLLAFYTTFHKVTGVDAKDIVPWDAISQDGYMLHSLKELGIEFKMLPHRAEEKTYISSAETVKKPASLEDSIDWNQYPKSMVIATGYTAGVESTGKNVNHPQYGITYSGVKVRRDLYSTIAADVRIFPIGTILFIPNYGYGVVADTGSAIKGNKIDLYYETVSDVYKNWGKKKLDIYIVKMGDGKVTEQELTALNEDTSLQVFRQQYTQKEE